MQLGRLATRFGATLLERCSATCASSISTRGTRCGRTRVTGGRPYVTRMVINLARQKLEFFTYFLVVESDWCGCSFLAGGGN